MTMAKEQPPVALDEVFGKDDGAMGDVATDDEDAETEEALDMAIDEAFSSEDPVARREAFKNAVRLCKEDY
jgi:hypothetical protein